MGGWVGGSYLSASIAFRMREMRRLAISSCWEETRLICEVGVGGWVGGWEKEEEKAV